MSKRGLPEKLQMRHDAHYVEELSKSSRTFGRMIPIAQIEPNPEQPRVEIGDLTELISSVKEKGVLEPLLVKPIRHSGTWMIIAGERRWRAATQAGLREVPCIELDLDERSIAEIALIENLQRKDLTVWEEADGLFDLSKRFGYTHDEIAKKIGKSRTSVTELIAVAGLPNFIRERCRSGGINSKSTLLELSRQFDEVEMSKLLDDILNKQLNRDEIRHAARAPKINSNGGLTVTKKTEKQDTQSTGKKFVYRSSDNMFKVELTSTTALSSELIRKYLTETIDSMDN